MTINRALRLSAVIILGAMIVIGFNKVKHRCKMRHCDPLCMEIPCGASQEKYVSLKDETERPSLETQEKISPLLEIKAGYFIFADSKMRKIFDRGGLDVQVSMTYPIWKQLQMYFSIEFLQRSGKSLPLDQKTTIWELPVSLGLQPVLTLSSWAHYYLTLGPRYIYMHLHNNRNSTVGGFINTGFHFFPSSHFVIDLFGEYSYAKMDIHPSSVYGHSTQIGGFSFGGGVGYAF